MHSLHFVIIFVALSLPTPYVIVKAAMHGLIKSKEGIFMTDSELRACIQTSPEEGCRALFETYFHYVYSIVYHVLRSSASHEDVEECVADVFLDVIQHFDPTHPGSVKAYVGTTAKRKAIDRSRSAAARNQHLVPLASEELVHLPAAETVEASVERTEQNRILLECIQALGEPDATIIIQKYFYDRNSAAIARIVGLSPAAVRMRCTRAMKQLKAALSSRNITL